jgi:hypothetical protein
VLPDRERSGGIDCALHLAVDEQLVPEFDQAFDPNCLGEMSVGLRCHRRAVGWLNGHELCRIIRDLGSGIVSECHTYEARTSNHP